MPHLFLSFVIMMCTLATHPLNKITARRHKLVVSSNFVNFIVWDNIVASEGFEEPCCFHHGHNSTHSYIFLVA